MFSVTRTYHAHKDLVAFLENAASITFQDPVTMSQDEKDRAMLYFTRRFLAEQWARYPETVRTPPRFPANT